MNTMKEYVELLSKSVPELSNLNISYGHPIASLIGCSYVSEPILGVMTIEDYNNIIPGIYLTETADEMAEMIFNAGATDSVLEFLNDNLTFEIESEEQLADIIIQFIILHELGHYIHHQSIGDNYLDYYNNIIRNAVIVENMTVSDIHKLYRQLEPEAIADKYAIDILNSLYDIIVEEVIL